MSCSEVDRPCIEPKHERGRWVTSDGCTAAIIGPGSLGDWAIGVQQTHTVPNSRTCVTWKPSNMSYIMFLDKELGSILGKHLLLNIRKYLRENLQWRVCK